MSEEPEREGGVAVTAIREVAGLLRVVFKGFFSPVTICVALVAATLLQVAYMALLPPNKIESANPADMLGFFSEILQSHTFCMAGWVILGLYFPLSMMVFSVQHKRIKKQGELNASMKAQLQPGRFSSTQPEKILEYWERDDEPTDVH